MKTDRPAALGLAERFAQEHPDSRDAIQLFAWALVYLCEFEKAVAQYMRAARFGTTAGEVYADSAYCLAETERKPKARGFRSRIHKRGHRNRPLSAAETEANTRKRKVRPRIEHVFDAQENVPGGRLVRTIGIVRAKIKIGLQNLAYNIRRLVILEKAATTCWSQTNLRFGAPSPVVRPLLRTNRPVLA